MKVVVFGGVPGSGKTSIIKHVLSELKGLNVHYVKFEVLQTEDNEFIAERFGISTEKKIAGDICPDHYYALELPHIVSKHKSKDLVIVETAGLCLRCSPYIINGLGISVADITTGKPNTYGPILTEADIVAINKGDLISQAEREIFRNSVLEVNESAQLVETNGLTGEGAMDIVRAIKDMSDTCGELHLKHSMPSAICGLCYGSEVMNKEQVHQRYLKGREIKGRIPNLNCGKCGFKTCNEFIRAVLWGQVPLDRCIYIKHRGD